jgi:Protein of unknown function (DUF1579)
MPLNRAPRPAACREMQEFGIALTRRATKSKYNVERVIKPAPKIAVACVALGVAAIAQQPPAWHDDLADNMVGTWKMAGTVVSRPAHHTVTVQWVLNHQFLEIHEQTSPDAGANESRYEAVWFLGYDQVSERYVLHLMDVFGARFSESLGYGTRSENDLRFVFEYPDGPFHTVWRWVPASKSWEWHMEQKDKEGKWQTFADLKLSRP